MIARHVTKNLQLMLLEGEAKEYLKCTTSRSSCNVAIPMGLLL